MIKVDRWITAMAQSNDMLKPFYGYDVPKVSPSRGLSSSGYDLTLGPVIKTMRLHVDEHYSVPVFDPTANTDLDWDTTTLFVGEDFVIQPGEFFLGTSEEYIKMPLNVMGLTFGKSSYARSGLLVFTTPIEAGWEGQLTIEAQNVSPRPVVVRAGCGIVQIVFIGLDNLPERSYNERSGKYQGQNGVTPPR